MERQNVLEKIQAILADVIGCEELVLTEESSPSNVEDWDSLAHFQLVMELQNEFTIKISAKEMQSWRTVGDIITTILSKS